MKKNNTFKSIIIALLVLIAQFIIYLLIYHSIILRWGASDQEIKMKMPGDKYSEDISSTRAIDINKPVSEVWKYLIGIGADRKGFYSYTFIEYLYVWDIVELNNQDKYDFNKGRLIPASPPDKNGKYNEGFLVIDVDSGHYFVLENWGAFLLNEIDKNNTRLLIRTHSKKASNIVESINNSVFDVLHYIMEKRMMLGIKDQAETNGEYYTGIIDILWFAGIFLSGLLGLYLVYISIGIYKYILPTIFYFFWQFVLLIIDPIPIWSLILLFSIIICIIIQKKSKKKLNKKH